MQLGRNLLYITFIALLVATFIGGHAMRAAAADYAELPASAEDTAPLKTGDRAPNFTVRTVDNAAFEFDAAGLDKPAILISFRGGWCPYCNLHLSELRTVIPELKASGYDVLFLSGDAPAQLYAGLKQETQEDIAGLDYTILSDAGIVAARAFGTAFRTGQGLNDYLDGKEYDYKDSSIGQHNALSVPFVYVVDVDGNIVYDFVEADYKVRLPADELLAIAKSAL
jgi:peroxiredoxin